MLGWKLLDIFINELLTTLVEPKTILLAWK